MSTPPPTATVVANDEAAAPPPAPRVSPIPRWVVTSAGVALAVAALFFGRELFVPIALAVLFSFVLDPWVSRLRQWRMPKEAAVATVMTLSLLITGAVSVFVASQVLVISKNLPTYEDTIHAKLGWVRGALTGRGVFDDVSRLFDVVEGELVATQSALEHAGTAPAKPMRVQVEPERPSPLRTLAEAVEPVFEPLATAGIVVLFVIFILLERSDLRDRVLRLVGGDLHRSTDATNEAARRVSRYLSTQLLVNVGYALPMGAGLFLIGVPGALLWGLLAGMLRFLPYLGPVLAAAFPLGMAFAVDPGWSMLLWTAGLIVTLELIINNLVEPWLYGASTGLTPMAVVLSAMFWATLWGPVGLVLATPLTVCLVVMSRSIPSLQFLDVLLGSQPVFDPPTRLYRRLLSGDVEEAVELANQHASQQGLAHFYQHTALPALRLAADDHAMASSVEHRHHVARGMTLLVDELMQEHPPVVIGADRPRVLCIAGRWELDGLAARLLAHALGQAGHATQALPASAVSAEHIAALDLSQVDVVVLSYFSAAPDAHVRYVTRRLRRKQPGLRVVAALWRASSTWAQEALAPELQAQAAGFACVFDIDGALTQVARWRPHATAPLSHVLTAPGADTRASATQRTAALAASGALAPGARLLFDQAAQSAADRFQVPLAVACLVGNEQELWQGLAEPHSRWPRTDHSAERDVHLDAALSWPVLAEGHALQLDDLTRDARLAANPLLRARDLHFYAAAPLRTHAGQVIGAMCVLDHQPRTLAPRELALLQGMADQLMASLPSLTTAPDAPPQHAGASSPASGAPAAVPAALPITSPALPPGALPA